MQSFGSGAYYPTPYNIVPEPGDNVGIVWGNQIGSFTQRFSKMATFEIASLADGLFGTFDYSALRCDFFPPVLNFYVQGALSSGQWEVFVPQSYTMYANDVMGTRLFYWSMISGTKAFLKNATGTAQHVLMQAYL
jgi:hypothetical protein